MSATNTKDPEPGKTETVYRVRVTKIVRNFPFRNRDYQKIGEDAEGEAEYAYVYFDDSKDVETDVYEQTVEEVDMTEVIKAVNGMEG